MKKENITVSNVTAWMAIALSVLSLFLSLCADQISALNALVAVAMTALCFLHFFVPSYQKIWFFSILGVALVGVIQFFADWNQLKAIPVFLCCIVIALTLLVGILLDRIKEPNKRAISAYFGIALFVGACWSIAFFADLFLCIDKFNALQSANPAELNWWPQFVRIVMNVAFIWLGTWGVSAYYKGYRLMKFKRNIVADVLINLPWVLLILGFAVMMVVMSAEQSADEMAFGFLLRMLVSVSDVLVSVMLVVWGVCVCKHAVTDSRLRLLLPMVSAPLATVVSFVWVIPFLICSGESVSFWGYRFSSWDFVNMLTVSANGTVLPYTLLIVALLAVFATGFYYRYHDWLKAAAWSLDIVVVWILSANMLFAYSDAIFGLFLMTLILYVPALIFTIVQLVKYRARIATFDQRVEALQMQSVANREQGVS